jgi:hypothetical protein
MATQESRITTLEEKDKRRDDHYKKISTSISDLNENQKQLLLLLGGTALNGNKGFISLLNDVEKRVDAIEKKTDAHERDLSQVVWWGRLISIPILGLLIKEIFNIK